MSDIDDQNPRCDKHDLHPRDCAECSPGPRPRAPRTGEDLVANTMVQVMRAMVVAHPVAYQQPVRTLPLLRSLPEAVDRHQPATVHDYVVALTESTVHAEPRTILQTNADGTHTWITDRHRAVSPPLLEQLWSAVVSNGANDGGAHAFASKPAARIDAVDVAQDIDSGVTQWLNRHNLDHPGDVTVALRRAAAAAGDGIYRDVRSWWIRARAVTGWDSPAWRPDNTCPLCGHRGDLRVRLDESVATCLACDEAWDHTTIGFLAEHIRAENREDEEESDTDGRMGA